MSEEDTERIEGVLRKSVGVWMRALVVVGIAGTAGTAFTFYTSVSADRARYEEVHRELRRDVDSLAEDMRERAATIDEVRGDVAAIKASSAAWQRDATRRLQRIEDALDSRSRRR